MRDRIAADKTLSAWKRRDMPSAINTLAKVLGRRPEEIPAHPAYIRERLKGFAPRMAGLEEDRWRNVLSLVRGTLDHLGLTRFRTRYKDSLAPEWAKLFPLLADSKIRYCLGHFARYCGALGITPDQVDDQVLATFVEDMRSDVLDSEPNNAHRRISVLWNQAVVTIPSWPRQLLSIPDFRKWYVLPWSEFPASLKAELDVYLDRLAGKNPQDDDDFRPLKPGSIDTRRRQIHEFASVVVRAGRDAQTLGCLADLVEIGTVKLGLGFILQQNGKEKMKHVYDIACALKAMARHQVKVDEAQLKRLRVICRRAAPDHWGMSPKNREQLLQFNDPRNVYGLVTLPQDILEEMRGVNRPSYAQALDIQTALAVEILLMAVLRIENLTELNLGKHLIRSPRGEAVSLSILPGEVKNDFHIQAKLTPDTVHLLDEYLSRFRPRLLKGPSDWLFPGEKPNEPKSIEQMRNLIITCLKERCGIVMTPHQFRHFGTKSYIDKHPGAHGLMRFVLGHKSEATTTRFYADLDSVSAMEYFDAHILKLREEAASFKPAGPNGGRK